MTRPGLREPNARGEAELLARLRQGDEVAFRSLVENHHAAMWRVARMFVTSPASADEVVQETWLAVIRGLDRFEAPEDVDLLDLGQPRAVHRRAGTADHPVLVARRRGSGRGTDGRPRSLPRARSFCRRLLGADSHAIL